MARHPRAVAVVYQRGEAMVKIIRHNEYTTGNGASGEITLAELITELRKLERELKRGQEPAWNRKLVIIDVS